MIKWIVELLKLAWNNTSETRALRFNAFWKRKVEKTNSKLLEYDKEMLSGDLCFSDFRKY